MKIPKLPRPENRGGFTLIELLVVISIIAILAGFAMPVFSNAQKNGRVTDTLNNAKQISTALKMYAGDHDGNYPYYKAQTDGAATTTQEPATNSSEAFESLMPRYSSSKVIFGNKNSPWCKGGTTVASSANQYKLEANQCDWAYVTGLSETSDSRWPLMATAFAPGSVTYKKSTSVKGGVWGATDAVVVLVDHSAKKLGDLGKSGQDGAFIARPDKPGSNMFEKDSSPDSPWLEGDTVKVLEPLTGGG